MGQDSRFFGKGEENRETRDASFLVFPLALYNSGNKGCPLSRQTILVCTFETSRLKRGHSFVRMRFCNHEEVYRRKPSFVTDIPKLLLETAGSFAYLSSNNHSRSLAWPFCRS